MCFGQVHYEFPLLQFILHTHQLLFPPNFMLFFFSLISLCVTLMQPMDPVCTWAWDYIPEHGNNSGTISLKRKPVFPLPVIINC